MAFERDPNEIGALWVKSSAKGDYMTGTINGVAVVVFKVKSASDKAPDWRVLKATPRDGSDRPRRPVSRMPTAGIDDDDIGF